MSSAGLIHAIRKASRVCIGTGPVHRNLFRGDSSQLTLLFYSLLVINIIFAGLVIVLYKWLCVSQIVEFLMHILIYLELLLTQRFSDINLKLLRIAALLPYQVSEHLKSNFLYCALPADRNFDFLG